MRFAFLIIPFLAFATEVAPLPSVMAREAEDISDVRVRKADRQQPRVLESDEDATPPSGEWIEDHLQQASSVTSRVSEGVDDPASDLDDVGTLSTSGWEDDGLDKSCLPTCYGPCPTVYGQVEALFMKREPRFLDQPIIVDDNTNATLLSTSNLNYNFDPGLRATVGKRLHCGPALEFTYFGLFEGDASATVVSPGPNGFLIFPDNFVGNVFVDMERVDVNYSSWLHSFELNLVGCSGCCCDACSAKGSSGKGHDQCGCRALRCRTFEWFAGFRYIKLGEELNIAVQGPVAGETGAYNIRTDNNLYGGQLGARVRRSQGRFGWEGTGKAGLYGVSAEQNQSVIDFPNFQLPGRTVSSSSVTVAFVGELNLSGFYALTDVWNVRAGYSAMWIEGLALGPNQLDFDFASVPTGISTGGGMFLHGANVGLEARW